MNKVETFLKDMSFNTSYKILDNAKDNAEIAKIAEKARIKLPAKDLAIFKGRYGYVNRMNLNGCTLPREEVEKSLDTLVGKAVDFDHLRERVVGHWIDAELVKDEIIAYGVFFKGNFNKDYDEIKTLMDKDVLGISFEAWGNQEMTDSGEYNLRDIEFAGGALLIKTNPAFPGSEVFEMSKEKILEFAKVMTAPKKFVHALVKDFNIYSTSKNNSHSHDFKINDKGDGRTTYTMREQIEYIRLNQKVEDHTHQIINFKIEESNGHIHTLQKDKLEKELKEYKGDKKVDEKIKQLLDTASDLGIDVSGIKLVNLEEAIRALTDTINKKSGTRKVKCRDCALTFNTRELAKSTKCTSCGGIVDLVSDEGKKKLEEAEMEELKKEIATLKEKLSKKDEALQKATATIEELKKESEEAKVKIEEIEKSKDVEITKAREDATKLAERKAELGETELSDEDLLNEDKFEKAKLEKQLKEKDVEIADLKETDPKKKKPNLDKGSANKTDELTEKSARISKLAWGDNEKE